MVREGGGGRPPEKAKPGSAAASKEAVEVIAKLESILKPYKSKASAAAAVVQDFSSFKQALNVSSGDQRLLVFTVSSLQSAMKVKMQGVANHRDVVGKYHFDFSDQIDSQWSDGIEGDTLKQGVFIIKSGEFGLNGEVLTQLAVDSTAEEIRAALAKSNKDFANNEVRKDYGEHLRSGRESGINYVDNMPYGEDRDGDGVLDPRPERP